MALCNRGKAYLGAKDSTYKTAQSLYKEDAFCAHGCNNSVILFRENGQKIASPTTFLYIVLSVKFEVSREEKVTEKKSGHNERVNRRHQY